MNNQNNKDYYHFRDKVDKQEQQLSVKHSKHLQCKKGCDKCCMDYSIFPVEFFSIIDELKSKNITPETSESKDGSCIFLKDHSCMIYESRPVICRTHGLPLLYTNDEGEWELSACDLNFTEFEDEFTEANTFPQDKFNSKLFLLNKEFIKNHVNKKFGEFDLIPIKRLPEFFK